MLENIKALCEQTREANKRIKMFFGLCLILFGLGNIVADFHVFLEYEEINQQKTLL